MPVRVLPLVSGEIYHVFNVGLDHRPTFTDARCYRRAVELIKYYSFYSPPLRFSHFLSLEKPQREEKLKDLLKGERLVQLLTYCLMPNHFHFLLRQVLNNGISKFMGNFQNSYTRYFNTKSKRNGALFLGQFKGVRIETEKQLLHVSRYIHLNPYSSYVVRRIEELESYPWSSLREYLNQHWSVVSESQTVGSYYDDVDSFRKFVFDQADYQRQLEKIKHLIPEV